MNEGPDSLREFADSDDCPCGLEWFFRAHADAWEAERETHGTTLEVNEQLLTIAKKARALEAANAALRDAIFDGRLRPAHFKAWAEQEERKLGYKSELIALLYRLAAIASKESEP